MSQDNYKHIVVMSYTSYAASFGVMLSSDQGEYVVFASSPQEMEQITTDIATDGVTLKNIPMPVCMSLADDVFDEQAGLYVKYINLQNLCNFGSVMQGEKWHVHEVASTNAAKAKLAELAMQRQGIEPPEGGRTL